jgi:hypothetical protein
MYIWIYTHIYIYEYIHMFMYIYPNPNADPNRRVVEPLSSSLSLIGSGYVHICTYMCI